jgi:uncharacterized repeat protein (TIGR03847 family)
MPRLEIKMDPVSHISTGAAGKVGQRHYYIQARQADRVVTLVIDKAPLQTLMVGIEQFIDEIFQSFPELPPVDLDFSEEKMRIDFPVDPLFRVGEVGIGFEQDRDLMVIILEEKNDPKEHQGDRAVARFWGTRSQMRSMSQWTKGLIEGAPQRCKTCGEIISGEEHYCKKNNGHH